MKTLLQSIRLYPTLFYLDVWVCSDTNSILENFSKQYGAEKHNYKTMAENNAVTVIHSTRKSELKGEKRIVMKLFNFNKSIIVHELSHVTFYLQKLTGVEVGWKAQEWVAYFNEYLFDEITNKSKYTEL